MKIPIRIAPNDADFVPVDTAFIPVARIIAKGEPPPWLLIGLNHFGSYIASDTSDKRKLFQNAVEQMDRAAEVLLRWLPFYYQSMGYGAQCPDEVTVVLASLPRIKKDLELLSRKRTGRRPDVRREICAAVIIEAWKLIHGKAEPRSQQLEQACKDYWGVCGGAEIGATDDPENWRRPIERALATDHEWVRAILQHCTTMVAVQNEH
jgi:hypothetical protein